VVGHHMRLFMGVVLVSITALWAASVAAADMQVGTQDPSVTVSSSLKSRGLNPELARVGDVVDADVTVDSNVFETSYVRVYIIAGLDGTRLSFEKTKLKKIRDAGTWDWSAHAAVRSGTPPGVYNLSVIAITPGVINVSTATASITVVG
jgi:hypothetical protein